MNSEQDPEKPLYVNDILSFGQADEVLRHDLNEAMQSMPNESRQQMINFREALRAAGTGILQELERRGVPEAEKIRTLLTLQEVETAAWTADLGYVALNASEAQYETDDPELQRHWAGVSCVAHVVGAVATMKAVRMYGVDWESASVELEYAQEQIVAAPLSERTKQILEEILASVRE